MTVEQYRALDEQVRAVAGVNPEGLRMHSCFAEGENLAVFDVWESREAFEAFGQKLQPIAEKLGASLGTPMFVDMIGFTVA
jgi:heme-degrading monooxygenase HmoA